MTWGIVVAVVACVFVAWMVWEYRHAPWMEEVNDDDNMPETN